MELSRHFASRTVFWAWNWHIVFAMASSAIIFFKIKGTVKVAFFYYDDTKLMTKMFHGSHPASSYSPLDHISIRIASKLGLFTF